MSNQTGVVEKFASLIGTKRTSKDVPAASSLVKVDPEDATSRELLLCISKSVAPDDVVCTLPSLDMRKLDEDPEKTLLPNVGEHFPMKMEASVLHNAAEASAKAAQVEEKAAQTFGSLSSWTRSSVVYASKAISENAANSFSSLVESRVRAWTLLLLRHSLTGDSSSRSRLLSMLESIIKVQSAQIAFKPKLLPASVANMQKSDDDPDVMMILIIEIDLTISVHDKKCVVTMRAPGTISANFDRTEDNQIGTGLTSIDIGLNTGNLLESMVKEARMVVFNAVAKATSGKSLSMDSSLSKNLDANKKNVMPQLSSAFNSNLKLSASSVRRLQMPGRNEGMHQPGHRSMKANSSSIKLNKVLSTSTIQKTRSVQFTQISGHLTSKKPVRPKEQNEKLAVARLTSFKSFGRPHAGDFGSDGRQNNATFASFGGSKQFWGRDGKLASKPSPILPDETRDIITSQTRKNANATFDSQKPPIHLSNRSTGLGIHPRKKPIAGESSMPRTATAGEVWLLEKMKRQGL
jgi:hypothetical protein